MMLTEDWTAVVPDQPVLPMARAAALGKKKTTHHTNSLPKTECGICSAKETASDILAELSFVLLLSVMAL